jgi:outer membrane protein TolC
MNKLLAVAAIAVGLPISISAQSAQLTLNDCIAIALSENPTVKISDMEITKSDYSRRETLGALLPSISFDGSYSRTLRKQVAYMNMDAFSGFGDLGDDSDSGSESASSDKGIEMGLDNSYSVGFSASLPIIAPQLWASLKLSDTQIERSVEQARASRLDMVNQVKNAYYALLLAYDSRRVVQESYDMAKLTHDIYVKRQAVGDASEYEVLRTSVAMKNVEPEIIQCDIAIRRAHLQLAVLMGIDVEMPFEISGTLSDYEDTMYADALSLSSDLTNNTSLVMNTIETRSLEQSLSVARASWYPTLALSANYNWTSSSNGNPLRNFRWTPYSMIGLSLSFPLFQGGQRYNKVKEAQIQLDEMAYTRQNLQRSLTSQATLAIDNIKLNVKQISSSNESVHEAERAHDIQERSFAIGASSYLDLRDSELSLTRARLAYYQAIHDYLVANSDLELLLGNAPIDSYTNQKNQ